MSDIKKNLVYAISIIFILLFSIFSYSKVHATANPSIEQQITIINADTTAPASSTGMALLDTSRYPGATYYFEVVAKVSSNSASVDGAYNGGTTSAPGGSPSTITIPNITATGFTRYRSAAFIPTGAQNIWFQNAVCNTCSLTIHSARIIIVQTSATITDSDTQIDIGDFSTTFTNTSDTPVPNTKYWTYHANRYDHITHVFFEAVIQESVATSSASESLYAAGSNCTTQVSGSVVSTSTNATRRIRSGDIAANLVDGTTYMACASSSPVGKNLIKGARIIIEQSSGTGLTTMEIPVPLNISQTTNTTTTLTGQNFNNLFEIANWQGTFTYHLEATMKSSIGTDTVTAQICYLTTSACDTTVGQTVTTSSTSLSLVDSSDFSSSPPDQKELDIGLKTTTSGHTISVDKSELIVDISSFAIPTPTNTPTPTPSPTPTPTPTPTPIPTNPTIEQQISIINTDTTAIATNSGMALLDTSRYPGATYYFEVVAKVSTGSASVDGAFNGGTGSSPGTSPSIMTISSITATSFTRYRSSAFSPTGAQNIWFQNPVCSSCTLTIHAARVIIVQTGANTITDSDTQIGIGDYSTTFTSTSDAPVPNTKYWTYHANRYDHITHVFFEAVIQESTSGNSANESLYAAGSSCTNQVSGSVVTTTSNSSKRLRSSDLASALVDGTTYMACASTTPTGKILLKGARIIIEQSNTNGLTAMEIPIPLSISKVTSSSITLTGQNFYNLYEATNWRGTFTYHLETTMKTSSSTDTVTAQVCYKVTNACDTPLGSTVTASSSALVLVDSSDFSSAPPDQKELDIGLRTTSGHTITIDKSELIVDVNSFAIPTPTPTTPPTPTPTPLPTYSLSGTVFIDANNDGVQDNGETGSQGVTVSVSGASSAVTTTDSSGNYSFPSLSMGNYVVAITSPTNYSVTTVNPVAVPLAANTTTNFGIMASATPTIGQYEKYEVTYPYSISYSNPNDPTIVDVEAVFTSPTGKVQTIPGFYYQNYTRSLVNNQEQLTATGSAVWMVRYAPSEAGTYSYSITLQDLTVSPSLTAKLGSGTFTATSSSNPGFVRASGYHLQFDNGNPFVPLGVNAPWFKYGSSGGQTWGDGTYGVDNMYTTFTQNGVNFFRLWTCSWGVGISTPFAKPNIGCDSGNTGISTMDPQSSWEVDYMVDQAHQKGIYINPILKHRDGSTWETADQVKSRYFIARWGYSTNMAVWDLNKESATDVTVESSWTHFLENGSSDNAANATISFSGDPYKHLRSTSQWNHYPKQGSTYLQTYNQIFNDPLMTFVQTHDYTADCDDVFNNDPGFQLFYWKLDPSGTDPRDFHNFSKPSFYGETGVHDTINIIPCGDMNNSGNSTLYTNDSTGLILKSEIWGSLMSTAGGIAPWIFHVNTDGTAPEFVAFKGASIFVNALPAVSDDAKLFTNYNDTSQATTSDPTLRINGRKDLTFAMFYIQNTTGTALPLLRGQSAIPVNGNVTLEQMNPNTTYIIKWYDTDNGTVLATNSINSDSSGNITLTSPTQITQSIAGILTTTTTVTPTPSGTPTPTPTPSPTPLTTPTPTPIPSYIINGTIFTDSNNDGVQDNGETGYQGATITLSGDGNAITTTDTSGYYSFGNLSSGQYTITLTTPNGYTVTTNNTIDVPLNANTTVNLGIIPTGTPTPLLSQVYTVSGTLFTDSNENGVQDGDSEVGYQGATITLSGASSTTTATDTSGNYTFSNLSAGTYTVTATLPGGYTFTTTHPVTTPINANTTVNFGIILSSLFTPTPSPILTSTPTPTNVPAQNTSSASGGGSNNNSSSSFHGCSDSLPNGAPDLFQINTTSTTATLYFAPAVAPYSSYYVSFGNGALSEGYGAQFSQGFSSGSLVYTVYQLSPNTIYTFKVRAGNGCATGKWSGDLSVKTLPKYSRAVGMYYPTRQAYMTKSSSIFSSFSSKIGSFLHNVFPTNTSKQPQPNNQGNLHYASHQISNHTNMQIQKNANIQHQSIWDTFSRFFNSILHIF